MKRYVKEFANDQMRYCSEKRKLYIEQVMRTYERGIITSFEAVELIVNSYYSHTCYEI